MRQAVAPERVVAVAEVGIARAEEHVDQQVQRVIARTPQRRDVAAAPAEREARTLGEVVSLEQRGDEQRDLRRIGRAVGIEHHDDVAGGRREAAGERVALAARVLKNHADVRADRARHGDRVVDRMPVDDHDLVDERRQAAQHVRQVRGLVERRNDDADRRSGGDRAPQGREVGERVNGAFGDRVGDTHAREARRRDTARKRPKVSDRAPGSRTRHLAALTPPARFSAPLRRPAPRLYSGAHGDGRPLTATRPTADASPAAGDRDRRDGAHRRDGLGRRASG